MQPDRRDIRIARQKRRDLVLKRIEHAFRLAFAARQRAGSGLLVFTDNPVGGLIRELRGGCRRVARGEPAGEKDPAR